MAEVRSGTYGTYYGSTYSSSESLTQEQMEVNAKYIYRYLKAKGWDLNAIAGVLGNMQVESTLNPGRWQSDNVGNTSGGYGLVQWTPATNYINWCDGDPSTMDNNLARIIYELENGLQWIATDEYNCTFEEFATQTGNAIGKTTAWSVMCFLKNYERAGVEAQSTRISYGHNWFEYLYYNGDSGTDTPIDPGTSGVKVKKSNKFNFILFNRKRKFY